MYILIADWGTKCGGERYSFHITNNKSKDTCFWTIDASGDPCGTKYKLFDCSLLMDIGGIETQENIKQIYVGSDNKEYSTPDPLEVYNRMHANRMHRMHANTN